VASLWRDATIVAIHTETPRAKTLRLRLAEPSGHLAGQHYVVRLTAPDGYTAARSYSVASPPDDSNDKIIFSLTDVRCVSGVTACSGGALSDYTGELEVVVSMRITDKNNSVAPGGGSDAATVADTPYSFIAPCAATAGAAGAGCALTSSANALTPGLILDGKRTLVEFGRARVFDGGPDGLVATAPNTLFATQGLFVP